VALQKRSSDIREENVRMLIASGSEDQKRAFMATLAGETDSTISLHMLAAPADRGAARLALTTLLQRKGRVLDALTGELGVLRQRLAPEDRALLDQLKAVRTQQANQVNQGPGKLELTKYRSQLFELKSEIDRLEGEIGNRSAEYRVRSQPITLEQVQQAIPEGSALVELAVYRTFNPKAVKLKDRWGTTHYAAYLLLPKGEPGWVELGETKPIDQTVEALRWSLRNAHSTHWSDAVRAALGEVVDPDSEREQTMNPARTLDAQVMQPILKQLGATRTIFISPDGALNLIPFAALLNENGHSLIEDYHITYLTSGRDLLRLPLADEAKGAALVLANPDFDTTGDNNTPTVAANGGGTRSTDPQCGPFTFGNLPGTAQEALAVAPLLGIQPVTRDHATESTLKQVHQPSILHIATHGFFCPDTPEEPQIRQESDLGPDRLLPPPRTENPLLRSGLALAGANHLKSGTEDGLLTALEASGLDLWGTRLVVLSACETGVGEVRTGEGVYGLRRALVIAGAQTQVTSLWKVSDAATRDLMDDYYHRLKAGEGRSESLRQAQLTMLHSKDRHHPYYWASFIVSGDWRGLKK
jgi:CHAT domain-containing protein